MSIEIFAKAFNEKTWRSFVDFSRKSRNANLNNLDDQSIPEDIKEVLYFREREYAAAWLYKNVPILDNNKPIELLKDEKGLKAVKETLLRMPD